MIPVPTKNATHRFGQPENWDVAKHGPVRVLSVRLEVVNGLPEHKSTWKPTRDELNLLFDGGSIILTCCGSQPPVSLQVEPPDNPGQGVEMPFDAFGYGSPRAG